MRCASACCKQQTASATDARLMPSFVSGLELSKRFYTDAVAPLVGDLPHAAALLGWGSDVLGLDTNRSTDHGWGPRLQVFVAPDEITPLRNEIEAGLPDEFRGLPTRFGWDEIPVSHHVEIATLGDWLRERLGFDASAGVSTRDWLITPQQILLELTAGAVFHDDPGELTAVRDALAWYPDQVSLWLLACQWRRIDQEEPFVGRAAEVGDELGSRVVATRLVRDLMRLSFLLERRYAPYSKWLGSAFAELDSHTEIGGALEEILAAKNYEQREAALVTAVEALAGRHNALGVTSPVDAHVRLFHGRPFRVLGSGRFVDACLARVTDPWLNSLPLVGAIDQFVDSTDVLAYPERFRKLGDIYAGWGQTPSASDPVRACREGRARGVGGRATWGGAHRGDPPAPPIWGARRCPPKLDA